MKEVLCAWEKVVTNHPLQGDMEARVSLILDCVCTTD